MRHPRPPHHRPVATLVAALVAVPAAALEPVSDLPPAVVASFTRRVQPLVLNRCASGACHGGPDSPAPRFHRVSGTSRPDRERSLANLEALLDALGPDRDARSLAALLAAGHPRGDRPVSRRTPPLTTPERATLERWLAEVRAAELATDSGVVPAAAALPASQPPNRFRALLDAAANPPALPPPEEPRGLIFKNDEPPAE